MQALTIAVVTLVLGAVLAGLAALRPAAGPSAGPAPEPSAAASSAPSAGATPADVGGPAVPSTGGSEGTDGTEGTGEPTEGASPEPGSPGTSPGAPLPTATGSTCVPLSADRQLRVLNLNIHSARTRSGAVRLTQVGDELAAWAPDIALLQEVDRGRAWTGRADMPVYLAERLGASWAFGANVRRSPTNEYGTAVLSRYPVLSSRNHALPAPRGTQQRGLLHVVLDVGVELSVYTTHLENTSSAAREAQMRAIVGVLAADPRPKLLGGDLNASPGSTVLGLARRELTDTWAVAGQGAGHTMPAANPRVRIDYLMHAAGEGGTLAPRGVGLVRSAVADHLGLRASYDLQYASGEVCVPELTGPVG